MQHCTGSYSTKARLLQRLPPWAAEATGPAALAAALAAAAAAARARAAHDDCDCCGGTAVDAATVARAAGRVGRALLLGARGTGAEALADASGAGAADVGTGALAAAAGAQAGEAGAATFPLGALTAAEGMPPVDPVEKERVAAEYGGGGGGGAGEKGS